MPKKSPAVDRSLTSHGARNALRERIRYAFGKAVMPALDRICDVDWDWRVDPERASIVAAFGGKAWWAIDVATAEAQYSALSFFSPDAFRYYLPAFMMACVATSARRLPANVAQSTTFSLTPPREGDPRRERFLAEARGFTPEQRDAVREFLEYMIASHGDIGGHLRRAVKRYWAS